jgi:hypothetical protein
MKLGKALMIMKTMMWASVGLGKVLEYKSFSHRDARLLWDEIA